jgi:hypothetical protein
MPLRLPPGTGAETRTLSGWRFDGSISDADWRRSEQIVHEVIAEYGFTPQAGVLDRPGRHAPMSTSARCSASARRSTPP